MSTPARRAIYGKLAGDTTLNTLLGTPASGYSKSIYHNEAPDDAKFPYVSFSLNSGRPTEAFTDPSAFETEIWLVKAVDRGEGGEISADTAESIRDRISTLLNDANLSISGGATLYLRRQSDVEYPEVTDGVSYRHVGALYRLVWK